MSIKEVTMYTVCCDRCGKSADEGTEYAGWSDKDGALSVADNSDWSDLTSYAVTTEGPHYCPNCYFIDDEDKFQLLPTEATP
jgi:hypothetical protein